MKIRQKLFWMSELLECSYCSICVNAQAHNAIISHFGFFSSSPAIRFIDLIHLSISISELFIYFIFNSLKPSRYLLACSFYLSLLLLFSLSMVCMCGTRIHQPPNFYFAEYTIRYDSWRARTHIRYHFIIWYLLLNNATKISWFRFIFLICYFHSTSFDFARTPTLLLLFAFRYCVCHHFSLTPSICKMIDLKGESRRTHNDRIIHE